MGVVAFIAVAPGQVKTNTCKTLYTQDFNLQNPSPLVQSSEMENNPDIYQ